MKRMAFVLLIALTAVACTYSGKSMRVDVLNPAARLYDEGMDAYRSGDIDTAINRFKDIVEYYPRNGLADDALLMLAKCLEEKGELYSALAYYKLFVYRFPEDSRVDRVMLKIRELEKKLGIKKKKEG